MGCYRTILAGYDGSPEAEAAVHHAASLARDQNARLVLLTVVPHVAANPVAPATAAVAREIEGDFAKCLHRVTAALPADIGVECRIARGKPAPRILDIAGEMNADLIVIGSRGHGRLHDALTGCTSAAVVRESKVPVLLVRGDRTKGPGPFVRSEAIEDPMPAPVDPA